MQLAQFASQLGSKDPSGPPFRLRAQDLDDNFRKLRPIIQDGNARQYAIEETPDGWILKLYPDNGGIPPIRTLFDDAPADGKLYGRQNEAWAEVPPDAPTDDLIYARRNGAWFQIINIPSPPSSGTYVLGSINGTIGWLPTENC